MNLSKLILVSSIALSLGACQTVQGLKKDIDNIKMPSMPTIMKRSEDEKVTAKADQAIKDECPQVQIVDELSSLSEFTGSSMSESTLISRVNLSQVESACAIQNNQVAIDLTLAFKGMLGPKAKKSSNDKPFFSYPFFVAVTNPSGTILAKEIFAASMTYERNEKTHTYIENMRQIIPVNSRDQAKRYKVIVGFQLDPSQLKYNRKHLVPAR